jgi:hypothetical protein
MFIIIFKRSGLLRLQQVQSNFRGSQERGSFTGFNLPDDYSSKFETNQNHFNNSDDFNDSFLTAMNFEEDNLHKMIREYKTFMRKNLIKLIRIMTKCVLKKKGVVRIILCNEVEYIMFDFFAELLIKLIIYHKNNHLKIESCQFRNGKCYFIKLTADKLFRGNRMLILKEREIPAVKEMGLNGEEMFEVFDVCFEIPKLFRNSVINNMFRINNYWLIDSNFEFVLKFAGNNKFLIKNGINRIMLNNNQLKGGDLIPITIRIYGTELVMMIPPNTSTIQIYNIVATWMG